MDCKENVMTKTTCGPLFDAAVAQFCEQGPSLRFYAGYITGHAEKIWMGAVPASMFRPPDKHADACRSIVARICEIYELNHTLVTTNLGLEIWMFRDSWVAEDLSVLATLEENSPTWHEYRGRLTGVPEQEIDVKFHERQDSK
jgi:hypothetical protein